MSRSPSALSTAGEGAMSSADDDRREAGKVRKLAEAEAGAVAVRGPPAQRDPAPVAAGQRAHPPRRAVEQRVSLEVGEAVDQPTDRAERFAEALLGARHRLEQHAAVAQLEGDVAARLIVG